MHNAETMRAPPENSVSIIGTSGRLPLRTVVVLELTGAELLMHRDRWHALLADRRLLPKQGFIPHPSRIVKVEFGGRPRAANPKAAQALGRQHVRQLTEALAESPKPLIAHAPKRRCRQAEHDALGWLCTRLAGGASGLALIHTCRRISWHRLTVDGPDLEPLAPDHPR